ncbi:queuosine precursor transporter [Megalodesulfovibrio paquesii]
MNSSRQYGYLDLITGLFVALLLISNVASTKIVVLGPFTFDGGTLLFPLTYIFGDVLTEVYGYARSRRVIWTGFFSLFLLSGLLTVVQLLPAASDWGNQAAYEAILGQAPRIVIASFIAYFAGGFVNAYLMARMKIWTAGRQLWLRTIGSTVAGEGADTALFCLIAFWGVLPTDLLWAVIISNYVFKVAVEVLFTPLTYRIVAFLKRAENEDVYDRDTDFNPFILKN